MKYDLTFLSETVSHDKKIERRSAIITNLAQKGKMSPERAKSSLDIVNRYTKSGTKIHNDFVRRIMAGPKDDIRDAANNNKQSSKIHSVVNYYGRRANKVKSN